MGGVNLTITTDFSAQVKRELKAMEMKLGRVFAGIVEEAFVKLVLETPQYSGTMAASWNMTVNRSSFRVSGNFPFPDNPYQKGDLPAVMEALSNAHGKSHSFKDRFEAHGWTIQVANGVDYAMDVNEGRVKLRSQFGHSPGFVEQFMMRVDAAVANTESEWNYYANTDFLGVGAA